MTRRAITAILSLVFVTMLWAVPAFAQESPIPTTTTTTTTTTSTTTTTIEVLPTSTVAPTTTTTVEVLPDVVERPLPRTGSDLGGTTIFGLGLTAAGIVLAVGARRRRNRFDTVDS